MIDANSLVTLLGKTSNDPNVKTVLETMGYKQPVALSSYDEPTTYATLPKHGIEFIFDDEAMVKELEYQEFGDGDLILTGILLFNSPEDNKVFDGHLFDKVSLNSSRDEVIDIWGDPGNFDDFFNSEFWEKDTYRVAVDYSDDKTNISLITLTCYPYEQAKEKGLYGFKD
ncbi:hypothetical protein [Kangiella shandongensis]|uniref:hypothetical protein n=1 Tax=Kangiella shandongensis TaxID=2763258 RepID=UPI001CBFDFE7|nr:hypothetical protein [Kangiella shandongensis]